MKNIYFTSNASRSSVPTNDGWTCSAYGNGSKGICINNSTSLGFSYVCSRSSTSQSKIWDKCEIDTPYLGSKNIPGTTDLRVPKSSFPLVKQRPFYPESSLGSTNTSSEPFWPKLWIPGMLSPKVYPVRFEGRIDKSIHQVLVGSVLSEASKYGLNTPQYQSQVNQMSADDLSKQYQNWKVLEKQIMVGKVLSEADKYGLNNSFYQQQVNTMSDAELSKQYQEWKALEKRILVGKVLSQYSEATGKSIDEIDEQTKSDLNNADQASLEKIYKDNIKNKQVVLVGTILSQVNQITGKPLNELDQETIDFANNSTIATLQLIYNTNVNQKQLLENGTVGLYELYFRLPVNVSYKILYDPSYSNSDINKLLTRQLDLKNISNLNLTNNQIGDEGAKLLADSLAKGEMPNLKKLHLEGNKITDKGETALIKTMKGQVQDIVVLTNKINMTDKIISGTKEERIAIYKDLIEKGKVKGTYDAGLVIDKSFLGEIKNLANISKVTFQAAIGFVKCHFSPDDVAVGYAQDSIIAKLPNMLSKTAQYFTKIVNVKNIGECYVYVTEDVWTSEVGQQVVKHDLCLAGETEFCGE
jgi:Leucine-rich repeat (LRR) protein